MTSNSILPHTPGEWKHYERDGQPYTMSQCGVTVFTPGDILIAETYTTYDAAYIAQVANTHNDLVTAIRDALTQLSQAYAYLEGSPAYTVRVRRADQILSAALALARGDA